MSDNPIVPVNVRAEIPGQDPIPLKLVRVPDRDGCRVWVAYGPAEMEFPPGSSVCIDILPPRSTVSVALEQRGGRHVFAPEPTR